MAKRLTMSDIYDIIPIDGSILLRAPIKDCEVEADRRNMRTKEERYSVTAVMVGSEFSALITRHSAW